MNQAVVVLLRQVAVCWVAKDDVVQEALQIALQPVLGTMHELVSQPAGGAKSVVGHVQNEQKSEQSDPPLYPEPGNVAQQ